jgi:integrase
MHAIMRRAVTVWRLSRNPVANVDRFRTRRSGGIELFSPGGLGASPSRRTPHKLRHTFGSLLVAPGCDPGFAMDQLGRTDPSFTLRVYRHGMRHDPASRQALRELIGGSDWAAPNVIPVRFGQGSEMSGRAPNGH